MKRSETGLMLLVAVMGGLAIGCSTTESTNPGGSSPKSVRFGSEFTLAVSEQGVLPDGRTLRFDAVTDDSRCPTDVQCAWQGDAAVHLVAFSGSGSGGGGGELPCVLHTHSDFTTDTTLRGWKIRLKSLDPDPISTRTINQSEYRAHLEVTE